MNEQAKKSVLRAFPYGLYAVTVSDGGRAHGMLANWLTQSSFDPPMVAVAVEHDAHTLDVLRRAGWFGISVLAAGQRDLAGQLGRSFAKVPDKLKDVSTHLTPSRKTPVLSEALGWVECRLHGSLAAGDHVLVVGEVTEAGVEHEGKPLTILETGFKYSG